ncbi:hypothetical protein DL767_000576 [Monosporascus sp. MG133]|nr:hypothetical protein DL767_000576 [Monosporascus sp. MG133]
MWKDSEAISLWVELISERKREVLASVEQGEGIPTALASAVQQDITRDHLAKWDASARAWLQTADLSRQREYKQFLLIVQNVSIPIHAANTTLYSNVIDVWTSALTAMEGLVSGRPYVVRDGPVLLGLSAWHIYPDMVIFDTHSCNKHVAMNDSLVKDGGLLSLGISDAGRQEEQGVFWSLSLAHHKFYGEAIDPVEFGTGKNGADDDIENGWQAVIEESILDCFRNEEQASLAVSLGRRRPQFLPTAVTAERGTLLRLTHAPDLMFILRDVDEKVELLRRLAGRVSWLNEDNCIILCFDSSHPTRSNYTFATVFPEIYEQEGVSKSRKRSSGHHRWVTPPTFQRYSALQNNQDTHFQEQFIDLQHQSPSGIYGDSLLSSGTRQEVYDGGTTLQPSQMAYGEFPSPLFADDLTSGDHEKEAAALEDIQRRLPGEKVEYLDERMLWSYNPYDETVYAHDTPEEAYLLLFGQTIQEDDLYGTHAAIYVKENQRPPSSAGRSLVAAVTLEDILWCFESGFVDPNKLRIFLELDAAFAFFKVLWAVSKVYREPSAGGATITGTIVDGTFSPPILPKDLTKLDWMEADRHLTVSQGTAIGLIGYFETGYNIVEELKGNYNIIGLSCGDSIFILTGLLNDPQESFPDYSFTRIFGNTGNSGFSILSCPSTLMARKLDPGSWRVAPSKFDGVQVDHFDKTSLHLGFTDWRAPLVRIQTVGQRDADVNIIESVVSIRDAGKWVADVDIFQALGNARVRREEKACNHTLSDRNGHNIPMQSIDTWDQVLNCPDGPVVVRCFQNWLARLAIVSVLCQHSKETERPVVICPPDTCWKCLSHGRSDVIYGS